MENKPSLKPLVKLPESVPSAGFLEGDFGQELLKEYNGRVERDYDNNSNLRVLNYNSEAGVVTGSNTFAPVLANRILAQEGLRVATQADLEIAIRTEALQLRGHYEDTGLVLRGADAPNEYFAKDLVAQLKARGEKPKFPAVFNLTDLELVADNDSPYKLAFKLTDGATPIYAPVLKKDGSFSSDNVDEANGLPKKLGEGNRYSYTRSSGLSRLSLRGYLLSSGASLADSDSGGRVVVVSAEGTAPDFAKYEAQLRTERGRQITETKTRFEKAMATLKGHQ